MSVVYMGRVYGRKINPHFINTISIVIVKYHYKL